MHGQGAPVHGKAAHGLPGVVLSSEWGELSTRRICIGAVATEGHNIKLRHGQDGQKGTFNILSPHLRCPPARISRGLRPIPHTCPPTDYPGLLGKGWLTVGFPSVSGLFTQTFHLAAIVSAYNPFSDWMKPYRKAVSQTSASHSPSLALSALSSICCIHHSLQPPVA